MSSPIHFFDDPPDSARPPEDVRITQVRVELLPDGRRVVVSITLTPFIEKPDFDVTLLRDGVEARSLAVIGAMQPEIQLTLHLPAGDPRGSYEVRVDLLRVGNLQQTETIAFEVAG